MRSSFLSLAGSDVTTNTTTWEVLAGGHLDVAVGAKYTVANGGTLLIYGTVTVEGVFLVEPGGQVVLEPGGQFI